jgi:GDSL-like Lipase/Acylhydrolase family
MSSSQAFRPSMAAFLVTLSVLALGVLPLPGGLGAARDAARSAELNLADNEAGAGGYYEGLIEGVEPAKGTRSELALRLLGKPTEWVRFQAANVSRPTLRDFLQFDLRPDLDLDLFGHRFTTNSHGMRDREYPLAKPPKTFRIALLGSSIDMGWGVGDDQTYENLLEDWLNAHARLRGMSRRFEVLNFAVAAYGPLQRYALLSRKAEEFDPDLVIYSATMLDNRLLELHLTALLHLQVDPTYPFLRQALIDAGINDEDARIGPDRQFVHKDVVKLKVRSHFWPILDATLDALARDCQSRDLPLVLLAIPRAGRIDSPTTRAGIMARLSGIAARLAVPLIDLTPAFDRFDPATIELAAWDDHPNALGHRRIFLGLARALVEQPGLYRALFDAEPSGVVAP